MRREYWYALFACGFCANLAAVLFFFVPSISDFNASRLNIRILETRASIVQSRLEEANAPDEAGSMRVLVMDEFFASLAGIREGAQSRGLHEMSFASSQVDSAGLAVDETVVRVQLSGASELVFDYLLFLAHAHNIRFFALDGALENLDVELVLFHEG